LLASGTGAVCQACRPREQVRSYRRGGSLDVDSGRRSLDVDYGRRPWELTCRRWVAKRPQQPITPNGSDASRSRHLLPLRARSSASQLPRPSGRSRIAKATFFGRNRIATTLPATARTIVGGSLLAMGPAHITIPGISYRIASKLPPTDFAHDPRDDGFCRRQLVGERDWRGVSGVPPSRTSSLLQRRVKRPQASGERGVDAHQRSGVRRAMRCCPSTVRRQESQTSLSINRQASGEPNVVVHQPSTPGKPAIIKRNNRRRWTR
jgi:hypothetical protein